MFEGIRSPVDTTIRQPRLPRHNRNTSFNGQTRTGRNVEQKFGLINALSNLLEGLAESFKPLGDFLCKQWKSLSRLGRDTKHQVKQGFYDLRKEVAGSKSERARLKVKQKTEDLRYKGTEQAGAVKDHLKDGLSRLFG